MTYATPQDSPTEAQLDGILTTFANTIALGIMGSVLIDLNNNAYRLGHGSGDKTQNELTLIALEQLETLIAQATRRAELEGRLDELNNIYVDFDDRKLRHIEGVRLQTLEDREQDLRQQLEDMDGTGHE